MQIPLLTLGESKVYNTLIEIGESSVGNILKISKVSHSKIYDILKRLENKGLVSSINKNGKQFFSAAPPKALNELINDEKLRIKEQEKQTKDIIKQLENKCNTIKPTSILSAYEGTKGIKNVLEYILENIKKNENIYILGSPVKLSKSLGGYIKEWQKRRIQIGSKCKIISDFDAPSWDYSWWKESKRNKLTQTKKSKSKSPSYLIITKNLTVTIYFSKNILSFIVEEKDIADRYQKFFLELWNNN